MNVRGSMSCFAACGAMSVASLVAAEENSYWDREAEGWFWYRDPPPMMLHKREAEDFEALLDSPARPPEIDMHETLRKRLVELRTVAIMNPTRENVESYLFEQKRALDVAAKFADQWQRVVWTTAALDYALQFRPTNSMAGMLHDGRVKRARAARLRDLAETHGLALFFRGDCPLCKEMAKTVTQLRARHGIHVFGVSLDGSAMDIMDDVRLDNGIASGLGVETAPSVYLFRPDTFEAKAVGNGLMSLAELEERTDVIANAPLGTRF